jgi:single-stranded-DNA-specific exonuclease
MPYPAEIHGPAARQRQTAPNLVRSVSRDALQGFDADRPVLLLGHNDADGLASLAILARAFDRAGRPRRCRIVGRGESPWDRALRAEVAGHGAGGLVLCDLSLRDGPVVENLPTLVIDHHVTRDHAPTPEITLLSGEAFDPIPTTSLLAWWAAGAIADVDDLLWLAALGLVGDMAESAGFEEMDAARRRYGVTALRKLTALINAPRRTASGDAQPALDLLLQAEGPQAILSGDLPGAAALHAARAEVADAVAQARRTAPKIRGEVALLRLHSPCQIHPLIAQQWRSRLRDQVVIAANSGFRPGWVHFSARSARDIDLIDFLARRAPPGADENYGSGHRAATGGALRIPDWNSFIRGLGFGPDEEITA